MPLPLAMTRACASSRGGSLSSIWSDARESQHPADDAGFAEVGVGVGKGEVAEGPGAGHASVVRLDAVGVYAGAVIAVVADDAVHAGGIDGFLPAAVAVSADDLERAVADGAPVVAEGVEVGARGERVHLFARHRRTEIAAS